ncbi:MAG: hypothetical protein JSR95_19470 [Proteobacteria bacterium]|nr:hypothetical protein [Pseudomonadota bacterium]
MNLPCRSFDMPHHLSPRAHLLSNGRYSVMISAAGSGYSRWRDLAVSRWREDPTCDDWGQYLYLRDIGSGLVWSAGFQPVGREPASYRAQFHPGHALIERLDGSLHSSLTVFVACDRDAEGRRLVIENRGERTREIELTSYLELALAPPGADAAHPAFSKMFVQTEHVEEGGILLAHRRPRDPAEVPLWAAQLCLGEGELIGEEGYETDRAEFIGRGRTLRDPQAVHASRLGGHTGTVLDPVFSLRRSFRIAPGATASFTIWTLVAPTRETALELARQHRDAGLFGRSLGASIEASGRNLRESGTSTGQAGLYQRLANHILYADASLRAPEPVLAANPGGARLLWAHGISGDLPIVLARISSRAELPLVQELLRAHRYWRSKLLDADLVIVNEGEADGALHPALAAATGADPADGSGTGLSGRVFLLRDSQLQEDQRGCLQAAARAVICGSSGSLDAQVKESPACEASIRSRPVDAPDVAPSLPLEPAAADRPGEREPLEFSNGLGGFTRDGTEYLTRLEGSASTPAPWVNVIANPHFGFLVSAQGGGNTYSVNSREYQITPWSNDPVSETPGECFYIRDQDDGALWSPTALPVRVPGSSYRCWHGQGCTRFENDAHGIASQMLQFVAIGDPVKITRLRLSNHSPRSRRLSVTGYLDWVLGDQRQELAMFLVTGQDEHTGALWARNPWNMTIPGRTAFFDLSGRQQFLTTDRREFLGRHGTLAAPLALTTGKPLSNRTGAGLDACAALQAEVTLAPGESHDFVFLLGDAESDSRARELVLRYRGLDAQAVLAEVRRFWDDTLGVVQVRTPERSLDLLLNRWLMYQTLVCRLWARAGFYQASGAYGFRDQLQDVMALCLNKPQWTREHLLRAAARQFEPGDVQHWWLPSSGLGVRTRIADNRIWLPYVTAHYLQVTADTAVLNETVGFLGGAPLRPDQHEEVTVPPLSGASATLFEHCARALDISLETGAHGLPLFGTGDWNDGMNRVGMQGRGESVWMAWFLHATLLRFAPIAEQRGEQARAARWRAHAQRLSQAVERESWDGGWYRRGYYDDGTPLGSHDSVECRIDSIAQSWGVISGAADPQRVAVAMEAVNSRLVDRDNALIRLFTPAFDRAPQDPGYVKGYPPGLRENGGQYTHGAIWSILAFAMLGDGDRAGELFRLINPVLHGAEEARMRTCKVEPYVVCADLYTAPGHEGRGGWTWYTGSAGWMYRTALENMLGLTVQGDDLHLDPCVPRTWREYGIDYRHAGTLHRIRISNPQGVCRGIRECRVDGASLPLQEGRAVVAAWRDGRTHSIDLTLG